MAEPLVVIYLSDNLIRVLDLVDNSGAPGSTPVPVVSATVTANVKDGSGAAVVGPLTLTSIAASNDYEALIDDTSGLELNQNYEVDIDVDDGAGRKLTLRRAVLIREG